MTWVERNPISILVGLLAFLLSIFLVAFVAASAPAIQMQAIAPSKWDGRMVELDRQALDNAYATQMGHVFGIWIKDGVADSSRARIGFANARRGYNAAMTEIERRDEEIKQRGR